jgi:CRP/FNR family transcriptional regulator, cyclic AMP receptor protein
MSKSGGVRPGMADAVVVDLLRRISLFADVPEADLWLLARAARGLTRVKGARIFEEGSSADGCYIVVSGLAKVVISGRRGTEITLDVAGEGELVGELALLDNSPRSASLIAASECRLIQIDGASFSALRRHAAFEERLVAHVTRTLRRATDQLRAIHTLTSAEHIEWCLARLAARLGRRQDRSVVISPRPHHQDIADMTGCTRETVTRVMRRLKAARAISWNATSLILDDSAFRRTLDSL